MIEIKYSTQKKDSWYLPLLNLIRKDIEKDTFWRDFFDVEYKKVNLHLGVFIEPYLQLVLDGEKTLESRFSINKIAPLNKVATGDILLLKRTAGPIVGICQISDVLTFSLNSKVFEDIKNKYNHDLRIQNSDFWIQKNRSKHATLMKIENVVTLRSAINFTKKDRRGWIVLHSSETEKIY